MMEHLFNERVRVGQGGRLKICWFTPHGFESHRSYVSHTRMSEWLRRQIQDLLRKLMGSNPISCTLGGPRSPPTPAVVAQW